MTLVNAETGEIVTLLSKDAARKLTDEIKQDAQALSDKLVQAYDGRAWAALGYSSWREYAAAEFDMSQSRAYQLLDMSRVMRALEAASSTNVERPRNEAQARALAPLKDEPDKLAEAWKSTLERTNGKPTARALQEAVADAIREQQEQAEQRAEDKAAIRQLAANAERAGLDMDDERIRQRGEFSRLCRDIAALPEPMAFIKHHGDYLRERHGNQAIAAHAWLSEFVQLWGER